MPPPTSIQPSDPDAVEAYLARFQHPRKDVLEALRQVILAADPTIGEEIKWNAPTFFYTGALPPSDPKQYKRVLVVSNVFKQDAIRLVFWGGGKVKDTSGLLTGDYADGRRLATFSDLADARSKQKALKNILKQQLKLLDK
jgi:hypothetical protein